MDSSLPASLDEFASGETTRLRGWLARLSAQLFAPPYLPGRLIRFALLSYVLFILYQLAQQPPEYWVRWNNPLIEPLFGDLLKAGVWAYLAASLAFVLLEFGLLALMTSKVAFLAWAALTLLHFSLLANVSDCGFRPILYIENTNTCRWISTGLTALDGLVWALALAGALSWLAAADYFAKPNHLPRLFRAAEVATLVMIILCAGGLIKAVVTPRPTWRLIPTSQAAPARYSFSLAYDTRRQRAVFFGGGSHWRVEDRNWYGENDTWEWDGATWKRVTSPTSPPPRLFAGMAYDEKRGVTVLFGGAHLGKDYNDTWEWDGQQWTERTPAARPGPRERFQMIYDPVRQKVILYGGYQAEQKEPAKCAVWYKDAWAWDGENWTELPMQSDLQICCYAATFDRERGVPLLFNLDGLRVWSGDHFNTPSTATAPPGRGQGGLAYDPTRQAVISFGGDKNQTGDHNEAVDDTWLYDGENWQHIFTAQNPPMRLGHALFYDATRKRVLLFGGFGNEKYYNDIWELLLP